MANECLLPTSIEQLPTEIFLQIFAYFPLQELITAFFGKQIARLIMIKTDVIDLTALSNLRSLTLKYTSDGQLKSIRAQDFPLLEILHIYVWLQTLSSDNAIEVDDLFKMIFNNAFPHLWLCTAIGIVPLTVSDKWSLSPSLRFLYVPMKTSKGYEPLSYTYICPNLRWIPSAENVAVDPINFHSEAKKRIWNELNELNQLEFEGKFIPEVNPFIVLKSRKRQLCTQQQSSVVLYARIFTQVDPYCHASFLIEIYFPSVFLFECPEITFLDPIRNPNIDANATERCCPTIATVSGHTLYPNGEPINAVKNILRNSPPVYKDEVQQFFSAVNMYTQDFDYELSSTYEMARNPDKIVKANWTQIKHMLTCLRRVEHTCACAIENGRIKLILLRLKELVDQ